MTENCAVLVVEDDPQEEMLILRALESINIPDRVDVVRDGQQALDYIFCHGEFSGRAPTLPALILIDTGLPRVSWIDVLQRIRADPHTRNQPVAIMTSSPEEYDRLKPHQDSINIVMRKPLDFAELSKTVARLGVY